MRDLTQSERPTLRLLPQVSTSPFGVIVSRVDLLLSVGHPAHSLPNKSTDNWFTTDDLFTFFSLVPFPFRSCLDSLLCGGGPVFQGVGPSTNDYRLRWGRKIGTASVGSQDKKDTFFFSLPTRCYRDDPFLLDVPSLSLSIYLSMFLYVFFLFRIFI